jgi:septal ring factor EnvC (AmiA/AmiB activator)
MDQAWYKEVGENVEKIKKVLEVKDGKTGLSKAQEVAMLYTLFQTHTYFALNFSADDMQIMETNIRDDSNLFEGMAGTVSMLRTIREAGKSEAKYLEACCKEKDDCIGQLRQENVQWEKDYNGMLETMQDRIATLESGKYSIEEEWERAVARAEKAEVANLTMAKEIIRRKIAGKEELSDEERALIIQSME